jgi:pyridoxine kinase
MDYPDEIPGKEELLSIASKISKMGPRKVVITGMEYKDNLINVVYENLGDKEIERIISTPKIGVYRSGTGDVFSSIVIGSLVNGRDFEYAVQKAVNFINKCIKYTQEIGAYEYSGLCFEEYLYELA